MSVISIPIVLACMIYLVRAGTVPPKSSVLSAPPPSVCLLTEGEKMHLNRQFRLPDGRNVEIVKVIAGYIFVSNVRCLLEEEEDGTMTLKSCPSVCNDNAAKMRRKCRDECQAMNQCLFGQNSEEERFTCRLTMATVKRARFEPLSMDEVEVKRCNVSSSIIPDDVKDGTVRPSEESVPEIYQTGVNNSLTCPTDTPPCPTDYTLPICLIIIVLLMIAVIVMLCLWNKPRRTRAEEPTLLPKNGYSPGISSAGTKMPPRGPGVLHKNRGRDTIANPIQDDHRKPNDHDNQDVVDEPVSDEESNAVGDRVPDSATTELLSYRLHKDQGGDVSLVGDSNAEHDFPFSADEQANGSSFPGPSTSTYDLSQSHPRQVDNVQNKLEDDDLVSDQEQNVVGDRAPNNTETALNCPGPRFHKEEGGDASLVGHSNVEHDLNFSVGEQANGSSFPGPSTSTYDLSQSHPRQVDNVQNKLGDDDHDSVGERLALVHMTPQNTASLTNAKTLPYNAELNDRAPEETCNLMMMDSDDDH